MTAPFRILVVCSGNVCRSPLAERLLTARLADVFGPLAERLVVTSAGTAAVVGSGMDPRAAAVGATLGVDTDHFRARSLTAAHVAEADLVLGATREHRAAAVRLMPAAHRRAFTVLEFARLCRGVDQSALQADDLVGRCRALVAVAASRRGLERAAVPEDDDVPDPHGSHARVHEQVGSVLDRAVGTIAAAISGVQLEPEAAPAARSRRRAAAGPATPGGSRRPSSRRRKRRRTRKIVLRSAVGILGLLALATGWLGVRGWQARGEMLAARADVAAVRTAVVAGDIPTARAKLADAQRRTARARGITGDPVWRLAATPPGVGRSVAAVRGLVTASDDVARDALPDVVTGGDLLRPDRIRRAGGAIDVASVQKARPSLEAALDRVSTVDGALAGLRLDGVPGAVADPVRELRGELDETSTLLTGATRAARVVPTMLGVQGTRRYLVVFQNNAEARGTGGLPGIYAILRITDGRIQLEKLGNNTDLRNAPKVPIDLGPEFLAQWGQNPAYWANSNLDPQFPKVAKLWLALWQRQTGQRLDGAIATDPVAVSYLLAATGPVTLPGGEKVSAQSFVPTTMSTVYRRFPDSKDQNTYLRTVGDSALKTVLSGRGDPQTLLRGLVRASGERRLSVYSVHPGEQRELESTALSGRLSTVEGPYAFVVVNNMAGSKMDYYLQRTVRYETGACSGPYRTSRVTVTLGNAARSAAALPEYVRMRLDEPSTVAGKDRDEGAIVLLVSVYGPRGGILENSTTDRKGVSVVKGVVGGRPVWTFPVTVDPGRSRTVELDLSEPSAGGTTPVVPVQPLVRPQSTVTTSQPCS